MDNGKFNYTADSMYLNLHQNNYGKTLYAYHI